MFGVELPDDFVERTKAGIESMQAYEAKEKVAHRRNREEQDELVSLINGILDSHNISTRIHSEQVEFRADFITNIYSTNTGLTDIIYDFYFPKPSKQQHYHYTSIKALRSIIENQELRLYNLNKRFHDDEFVVFYREHGMDGYDVGGATLGIPHGNQDIMENIYYISLSMREIQQMWVDFAEDGEGVRLGLEVDTNHRDYRQVYYSTPQTNTKMTLVKELEDKMTARWGIPFVFSTVSKVGAFYIKGCFSNEYEVRFLIKTNADEYEAEDLETQAITTDATQRIRYITLPLQSAFGVFYLKTVQPGYNCSPEDIEDIKHILHKFSPATVLLPKAVEDANNFGF